MGPTTYIVVIAAAVVVLLAATGWWRWALTAFQIKPADMTVDRLGLLVPTEHVARIDRILGSFAGGFNSMMSSRSISTWDSYCDSLGTLYRPFAREGGAMGYVPRRLFRYDAADFEARIVKRHCGFAYLYYVGLGFWSGMRRHDPGRLPRLVHRLDPLHGFLFYDGYGFKHGFFDYAKDPASLGRLDLLDGYARNAAYQGVGRAFFFRFMGQPDVLIEHIERLNAHAVDAAGGVGLASVFVFPDRLEIALELADRLPRTWRDHVHLGMCFGLKARSVGDPQQFERDLSRSPASVQEAIRAAIEECDRVEAQLRSERAPDGYRRWRETVTQWMAGHIEYPLAQVRPVGPEMPQRQAATT